MEVKAVVGTCGGIQEQPVLPSPNNKFLCKIETASLLQPCLGLFLSVSGYMVWEDNWKWGYGDTEVSYMVRHAGVSRITLLV